MDFKILCNHVIDLVKEVGQYIKENQAKIVASDIESKGVHDFVSFVDKTAEKMLVERLKTLTPEAGFIAEEKTDTSVGEKYNWIIDPLDGTTNYIHGYNPYAISIALQEDDNTVLGVVYEISLDECFYSYKGADAFLNGDKISVSEANSISSSLIATGFPYYDFDDLSSYLKSLEYFIRNSHGVRRAGSAATDLAYVACGRFDAFYEYNLNAWDVAAGAFLIEQAGGMVSDFKAGNDYIFGRTILGANKNLYSEFQNKVESFF
ncbi:MAG: inositol monophosphatase [Marinifilaceae bacterium]|jgi:myo-inositol-1(or 4)-monophosphatase|nr:inositol monophosphatase [Marinifilaceae bacterium]